MTRRKTPKHSKPVTQTVSEANTTPVETGKGKKRLVLLLSILMCVGLVIGVIYFANRPSEAVILPATSSAKPAQAMPVATKEFVGASACKQCHQVEVEAWQGSHHELAM